ncbi:chymotrypsin-2-like [Prorops nasuta]|uniref:chymotrypsin-2-like n=1 Tax=Prorops nasuta TaxID=863751 RepID=UPI0034CD0C9A
MVFKALFACSLIFVAGFVGKESYAHRVKRIVGGTKVVRGEIPYQISLRAFGQHICGGALIDNGTVITAAHCLCDLVEEPYEGITVIIGSINLKGDDGKSYRVVNVQCHPDYIFGKEASWVNDVAIVTLDKAVVITSEVSPIALPDSDVPKGAKGLLSGWGRDKYPEPWLSKYMLKLEIPIMDYITCQTYQKNYTILPSHICGFAKEGVGSCKGDSGNPLVHNKKLVGIFSWTFPCAMGYPDVYSNVYYFLDFIKKAIQKSRQFLLKT